MVLKPDPNIEVSNIICGNLLLRINWLPDFGAYWLDASGPRPARIDGRARLFCGGSGECSLWRRTGVVDVERELQSYAQELHRGANQMLRQVRDVRDGATKEGAERPRCCFVFGLGDGAAEPAGVGVARKLCEVSEAAGP